MGAREVQRPEFMCFLVLRFRAYGYLPLRPVKHDVENPDGSWSLGFRVCSLTDTL